LTVTWAIDAIEGATIPGYLVVNGQMTVTIPALAARRPDRSKCPA
jgi:hypothetical protein